MASSFRAELGQDAPQHAACSRGLSGSFVDDLAEDLDRLVELAGLAQQVGQRAPGSRPSLGSSLTACAGRLRGRPRAGRPGDGTPPGRSGCRAFFSVGVLRPSSARGSRPPRAYCSSRRKRVGDLAIDLRAGVLLQQQPLELDQPVEPRALVGPAVGIGDEAEDVDAPAWASVGGLAWSCAMPGVEHLPRPGRRRPPRPGAAARRPPARWAGRRPRRSPSAARRPSSA